MRTKTSDQDSLRIKIFDKINNKKTAFLFFVLSAFFHLVLSAVDVIVRAIPLQGNKTFPFSTALQTSLLM
ncbi:MAG: hypothetical protein MJB14_20275 [Spirochaetes bacterium]|nr:hypothetical protein [Spirochaetota bacterium]